MSDIAQQQKVEDCTPELQSQLVKSDIMEIQTDEFKAQFNKSLHSQKNDLEIKINHLETENQILLQEKENHLKQIEEFQAQKMELEEKYQQLNLQAQKQKQEADLKQNESQQKINQQQKNSQILEQKLINQQKQIEDLKLDYSALQNANKDVASHLQDKKKLESVIQQQKKDLLNSEKKLNNLKKICSENQLGQQLLNKFEKLENQSQQQMNTGIQQQQPQDCQIIEKTNQMQGYDVKIEIKCLKLFLEKGANILSKYDKNSIQQQNLESKNVHIVSFLGLKNVGKSYWHSKLCKQVIQQGNLLATEGINGNFYDGFFFIDSPGLGETLQNFQKVYDEIEKFIKVSKEIDDLQYLQNQDQNIDDLYKKELIDKKLMLKEKIENMKSEILNNQNELYKEKLALESFIQSFILEYSDIIIYVCDILTLEEQRYITQITQKIKENNKGQQLIVCHNMKSINNIADLQQCIKKDILHNFSIELNEKMSLDQCAYKNFSHLPRDKHDTSNVTHIVYGREGSIIEEKYNKKSIKYVQDFLKNFSKRGNQQNIFNSFKNFANKNIQQYIIWNKLQYNDQQEDEQQIPQFEVDYKQLKIVSLNQKMVEKSSIFCKDILTDFLGQKINDFGSGESKCFYEVYTKHLNKGSILKTIILSVPGINIVKGKFICYVHIYIQFLKYFYINIINEEFKFNLSFFVFIAVKTVIVTNMNKQIRVLTIKIIYDLEKCREMLQTCKVMEGELEENFQNHQKLQFQDIKIDIPICPVQQSIQKYGQYSYKNQILHKDFSVYMINVEINYDTESESE
ncbi:P-loop containing nucleoside triphosphate hydrolase [Pseudocohnilembus persalinus]|uniref:p-loop containing nucleoside triphosphate hydrolase n=1 Tax=Pseudocohnilembus persalinus TaxID=266149 RepID=A0A0V0Q820_PSEPJ|nr:P-loop containing nucleoside triphosphate hydrolase [Pseudocohnilembus persalinus]|eukprot:KRW98358.1 P-loop containing nucleoside triphosphate hydrolase [Pseudocohnilembus persalinus]